MLHKFKIASYTFILSLAALLFMTVSPGSANEGSKGPRWLQEQICQEEKPSRDELCAAYGGKIPCAAGRYGWREQCYKGCKTSQKISIWCKPKEYYAGRGKRPKRLYDTEMIIEAVLSKKSVPSCIQPQAYEKVLRIVYGLNNYDPLDIELGRKRAGGEASTFINSVIPGVNINEYRLQIASGIQAWTKFGHCAYKKCSEVGKFDPDTGEKSLCMDERGNVFGPGRDKYGRMLKHKW